MTKGPDKSSVLMVAALEKEQRLAELRALIRDREALRKHFDSLFDAETER